MKSELEKLITSNRAAFDTESPPDGHTERFSAMLAGAEARRKSKRRKLLRHGALKIAGLAASVVFAMVLINPLTQLDEEELDPQLMEAADYFAFELRNKAEEVMALADMMEPAHRNEVIEDIEKLSEISLDHIPQGMMSEEEKIGILFEHYQAKSSSLDMIENSLQTLTTNTLPQ